MTALPTSGVDLLIAAWRQLDPDEREASLQAIGHLHTSDEAGTESVGARLIRSLQLVCDHVGGEPSAEEYRTARVELVAAGQDVGTMREQLRHWGTWVRAKEALFLSATTSPRRIESRFRERRLGKVWKHTEATLRDTLAAAVKNYGRVPTVAEFDWWREREIQIAKAKTQELHLPSATPYRKRWGSWDGALRHFGYDDEQATERFRQA